MSNIGRVICGFCYGRFGRDDYYEKRIEAEGVDWIVARRTERTAYPTFASFEDAEEKQRLIDEWAAECEREEWQ